MGTSWSWKKNIRDENFQIFFDLKNLKNIIQILMKMKIFEIEKFRNFHWIFDENEKIRKYFSASRCSHFPLFFFAKVADFFMTIVSLKIDQCETNVLSSSANLKHFVQLNSLAGDTRFHGVGSGWENLWFQKIE